MVRSTIRTIVLLLLILGQISCIREGLQECEEEYFVTIKVVDALTGEDITASGEVSHADLFVFDADEQYRYTVRADSNQIRQRIPIPITLENIDDYWLSVWGNLDGNQHVTEPGPSDTLDNSTVSASAKEGENQYQTLDDLFFGIAQIGKSLKSPTRNEEIIIARKNARMYLTVRGLPAFHRAIDYYFTIHLNNNGYNFKGTPVPNAIEIKQNGITLANNDFVSPSSFNLIHTDSNREDYATVNLYRRSDVEYGEDILIASINSDLNGNPIVLPAGLTTNLLIDLRQEISVHVKTSPWEKTEQWVEW
ncbi:FimB/Mfa2 family fimbrial subunit [uncultured Parabacteroides sp.]|jgi:hypothetical protein|uniref:FimB/Mfa2 family fimbrial subunit n=1 Tax=uncultured Parabacteroides sp. TaxID=512312 RepID=UPI0025EBEDCE|nr:FimB/Mfa2 family fimbrial subunit [uncultured Parabacteroides sp.]